MLATSRKKEKGAHTSGCPATKIRGEKSDRVRLDGQGDVFLHQEKQKKKKRGQNESIRMKGKALIHF